MTSLFLRNISCRNTHQRLVVVVSRRKFEIQHARLLDRGDVRLSRLLQNEAAPTFAAPGLASQHLAIGDLEQPAAFRTRDLERRHRSSLLHEHHKSQGPRTTSFDSAGEGPRIDIPSHFPMLRRARHDAK